MASSFQAMMSGAECSTGANPIRRFMKHDRLGTQRQPPATLRATASDLAAGDQKILDEFYRSGPEVASAVPNGGAFNFEQLRKTLDRVPIAGKSAWALEFNQADPSHQRAWELQPDEALRMEQAFHKVHELGPPPPHTPWAQEFRSPQHAQQMNDIPVELNESFQRHFDWAAQFAGQDSMEKGKAKVHDPSVQNWERQFAALEQGISQEEIDANIQKSVDEGEDNFAEQFEHVWNDVRKQMGLKDGDKADAPRLIDEEELRRWENEFGDVDGTFDLLPSDGMPRSGEYSFENDNPFLEHSDPLAEGIAMIERGEPLSEAALAFEAACQRDPSNSEAWAWLGTIQAQNEKEELAMRALEKCIELDPGNLRALMALSVSYTNEGYDFAAYNTLKRWMNAKYPEILKRVGPQPVEDPAQPNPFAMQEYVTNLFIEAARSAPSENMDADVQVGLGVLFYGTSDYEKALDCFKAALARRPNDPTLLNRVGATMANSGVPEEAIDYYYKALGIQPQNMRVRLNLSVAYMNIGCYKEAADLLIEALQMQKSRGGSSEHNASDIWHALRKACVCLGRQDLSNQAFPGGNVDAIAKALLVE